MIKLNKKIPVWILVIILVLPLLPFIYLFVKLDILGYTGLCLDKVVFGVSYKCSFWTYIQPGLEFQFSYLKFYVVFWCLPVLVGLSITRIITGKIKFKRR